MDWSRREHRPAWALLVASAGMTVLSSAVAAVMSFPAQSDSTPPAAPRLAAMYQLPPAPVEPPAPVVAPPPAPETTTPAAPAQAVAATVPAAAPATPPTSCSGPRWEQRRGEAARDQLRHVAATRGVPVSFRPGRADVLGMADLDTRSVDVYVRSCAGQSDALLRHVLAHELGHVLDELRMDDVQRAQWLEVRGIPAGTPWYGCSACSDFATPAGDFAEVYAQWARGAASNRSQLAGSPGPATLAQLAARFFGA